MHMPSARTALAVAATALVATACADAPTATDAPNLAHRGKSSTLLYTTQLVELNNSGVGGTAEFLVTGDKIQARVHATGLAPNEVHPQHIHAGAECPFPESEFDGGDGLVEIFEAAPAYGLVLLPLDDQLVNQIPGTYPTANPGGVVNYNERGSLDALLGSLNDGVAPFPLTDLGGADLALGSRTVVVHGAYVKDNMVVAPGTAGATYWESLPVACGTVDAK